MEFRQLRYALSVARERSFTRAAQRLNISQSAVSEQVLLLEQRIGFPLFRRTGRGVEPTEPGRLFLYEAERVASDLLSLDDVARRLRGIDTDSLSLGIGSGLAAILLPRLFAAGAIPPDLHIQVRTAPTRVIFDELHKEHLDLGIAVAAEPDRVPSGLVPVPLFALDLVLIAPPAWRRNGAVALASLAAEPLIMSELSVGYGQSVMAMLNAEGVHPRIAAVVDNIETIKVMVQTGAGLAFVPAGAADNEARLGLLRICPIEPARRIAIHAYRARQPLARAKEAIVGRVLEALGLP